MNGGQAPLPSTRDEINTRLAGITSKMFREPRYETNDKDHVITNRTMSDDLKRLWTLTDLLVEEYNGISREFETFAKEGFSRLTSRNPFARMRELFTGTVFDQAQALKSKQDRLDALLKITRQMFWEDVRREFPEIADHSRIGTGTGWLVHWNDEPADHGLSVEIIGLGGVGMPRGIPPELAEILRSLSR